MPDKTPYTLGTKITFAAIALLTALDMGTGRIQPGVYYVYVDWRPVGEVHLLLDEYVLYNTKGVTIDHNLGASVAGKDEHIQNSQNELLNWSVITLNL